MQQDFAGGVAAAAEFAGSSTLDQCSACSAPLDTQQGVHGRGLQSGTLTDEHDGWEPNTNFLIFPQKGSDRQCPAWHSPARQCAVCLMSSLGGVVDLPRPELVGQVLQKGVWGLADTHDERDDHASSAAPMLVMHGPSIVSSPRQACSASQCALLCDAGIVASCAGHQMLWEARANCSERHIP